jgi:hypothetical protein
LFILLGIILISRTYLFRHESRQNLTENSNPAEDLKKNDVYDKDISRRTGTTLVSMEAVGQGKAGYKNAHNTEKSIATNLVTDGEKIIHYTMDNGTEVIFITGLN